jgi:perosamine synthetase
VTDIPLFKPFLAETVTDAVQRAMIAGALASGPAIDAFEEDLRDFLGTRHVTTVSNGSDGINLALMVAGVAPGDEVVMSPLCCLASAMPVLAHGASIRWCDIDIATGMPGLNEIQEAVTERTKAIVVYHWNGHVAPIDEITAWARRSGIVVIEDATEAFGARIAGRYLGDATADFSVFSFHAAKLLNTGEGGAVTVSDPASFDRVSRMKKFGIEAWSFRLGDGDLNPGSPIRDVGLCAYLDNISASVGRENLRGLSGLIAANNKNASELRVALSSLPHLRLLAHGPTSEPVPWTLNVGILDRDLWKERLRQAGIACQRLHLRCDHYAVFPDSDRPLLNVDRFDQENLSLPCGWWLNDSDIERIVATLASASRS